MRANKIATILVATLAALMLIGASNAMAWQPSGWVYHNGDYAYSSSDHEWYYFSQSDTQWRVNLRTGGWGTLDDASGWTYYNWPYAYSSSAGSWYWHNLGDEQWCCKLSSGDWTVLGGIYRQWIAPGRELYDDPDDPVGYFWKLSFYQEGGITKATAISGMYDYHYDTVDVTPLGNGQYYLEWEFYDGFGRVERTTATFENDKVRLSPPVNADEILYIDR